MSTAPTAGDRLRRVLAMVPWIVANPGVLLGDVAHRFDVAEADLLKDLNVVWMVGLPPYTPDSLIEVVIEDGRVWINYADFFSRPLRLSPAQALALLASTDGLLSIPGTEADGPLARALDKLGGAVGVGSDDAIGIDLGTAEAESLSELRAAAASGRDVEIDYYSYGRDDHSSRRIAPWRVYASGGAWYVEAWCHLAEGERIFRVDRIDALRPTGEPSSHRPDDSGPTVEVFHPRDSDPRITLRLSPRAVWVAETYPCEDIHVGDDDTVTARLVITATPWLERLLVRLGADAEIVDADQLPGATELAGDAARRILARYQS
jgi:proteasome accessory factor C